MEKIKKEKQPKEKKKLSKKGIILITTSLIVFISLATFVGFKYYKYRKKVEHNNLVASIKNTYNQFVKTTKNTKLYTKNLEPIGTISKDIELEIEKEKQQDFEYFKIKDTTYYLNYQDVEKIKELTKNEDYPNYIPFNQNVITKVKTTIFLDEKKKITFNKSNTFKVRLKDQDNYYIDFQNKIYKVKKSSIEKEVNSENTTLEEAPYISILNYEDINQTCTTNNCVEEKNFEDQLNNLTQNNYYYINLDEYKNWLSGNIRLKKGAIILTTQNSNDKIGVLNEKHNNIINIVNKDLGITLKGDNNKSTKESKLEDLSSYNIRKNTSITDYLKMASGEHVSEYVPQVNSNNNSNEQKIAVINYHFFYDGANGESCDESICLDVKNFREQLDYLKNNGYKTLTIKEYQQWMYGEIELPQKSVLLTIDDGAMGTGAHNGNKLIPILEEYNMHATLFLIAGWWKIDNYRSKNLDIQSHTYDMHNRGNCGGVQMICANYNELIQDLQTSIDIIGDKTSFCFPFYTYDDEAIQAVKDIGFKLAFIGGNRKSKRSDNKFKIPRYPIYKNTSLSSFINMVSDNANINM